MITRIALSLVCLVISGLTAFSASEDIVQRHLSAAAGGKLVVDVDFGIVEISSGAENQVVVDAHRLVDAPNPEQEKQYFAAAPITVSQEGDTITVRSRSDRPWHWKGARIRTDARYVLRLPANFKADVRTGGGSIAMDGLTGDFKAQTAGGILNFKRLHGPIDGRTNGGDVKLTDCDGVIKVRTNGGHIESLGGRGSLAGQTNGGSVSVRNFDGQVNLSSNGGSMNLHEIGGPLKASTAAGAIDATITAPTDVVLKTEAGAIRIGIPTSGGFNIDASTSVGSVRTELPVVVEQEHNGVLVGDLNGGGKSLYLRASTGSISINAAPTKTASVSTQ